MNFVTIANGRGRTGMDQELAAWLVRACRKTITAGDMTCTAQGWQLITDSG